MVTKLKIKGFPPNANKNGTGKYNSNVTGEDIEGTFDYNLLEHEEYSPIIKNVVNEVIKTFRTQFDGKNKDVEKACSQLELQFHLKNIPTVNVKESLWHQLTYDEHLGQSIQGYRIQSTDNGENKKKIPHIGFSSDLDYLDAFINRLMIKLEKLDLIEIKHKKE